MQKLLVLLTLLATSAGAENTNWQPSLWLEAVRVLGGLLLIIPLIYLAVRFWGKQTQGSGGLIQVLERVPLAQGKTLYLVKVGEEVFFLGAAERNIFMLAKYDADAAEAFSFDFEAPQPPQFQEILHSQLQRLKKIRTNFQDRKKE